MLSEDDKPLITENSRYESNDHGVQVQHHQHPTLTQERRKLLKRTRSLAVISEDESRSLHSGRTTSKLGSPFDTSSLQHRRPQLIPRAKLIDRNSLKDRLCKSQQHLSDSYERFNEISVRSNQSRSVCGLYSLPPPLDSLPDPLPYSHVAPTWRPSRGPPEKLNILNWPKSPRRYRSVQDLNSVGGFVDIIEDNYWPGEENRSVECIYTQVKRKRKEHRSLDSILFENDSDELEYFDILNLLPLSNVRLEINESSTKSNNVIHEASRKDSLNQELTSHPTVLSVLTKKGNTSTEKCYSGGISITEIEDSNLSKIYSVDGNNTRFEENSNLLETSSKAFVTEKGITSFHEISRGKNQLENISDTYNTTLDVSNKNDNQQSKSIIQTCYFKSKKNKFPAKDNKLNSKNNEIVNSFSGENQNINEKYKKKETETNKSHNSTDIIQREEMSRRPQVLKIVDNDVTKSKNSLKLANLHIKPTHIDATFTEKVCENGSFNQQTLKTANKLDLMNDHIRKNNIMDNTDNESHTRLSVENARSFFEKKSVNVDLIKNNHSQDIFEKTVKETSNILHKSYIDGKGSLGFESTSESSDLGLGSEVGSDIRRLSIDENTNAINEKVINDNKSDDCINHTDNLINKNDKNYTNLTRSRSCIDSIQSQVSDEPEFDHVRYKIVKSNVLNKNIINNSKNDVTYDGIIQYLREYSFEDLLIDNNVVIIEPVRAESERKSFFNEANAKSVSNYKSSQNLIEKINDEEIHKSDKANDGELKNEFVKVPRQSSLRKHFFYQPIRVNRELNDNELPDPDTVRNVKKMFEETMKRKLKNNTEITRDYNIRNSISMRDLSTIENGPYETGSEKAADLSRSRCSSRAKDLRKIFENLDKSSPESIMECKDVTNNIRNESKTRTIVQSFETRSGHTSPSNSNSSKSKMNKYPRHLNNWDTGSVSSGVSSDYPDTDVGSALPCTSSEDEELYCQDDDGVDERYEGHYVSQEVLKKIREYGTSVTYYGGKVVNTYNGPLISPMVSKKSKTSKKNIDYIKFRLVKSNSCDSRLELTGRIENNQIKYGLNGNQDKGIDLRQLTINELPSIEITSMDPINTNKIYNKAEPKEEKHELPVVIGLEPKKEESKSFKANFKLGKIDDCETISRFTTHSLTRWQINENIWKRNLDFGKMEFEEYEILEDSLNGINI